MKNNADRYEEVLEILDTIRCGTFGFRLRWDGDRMFLQVTDVRKCAKTGDPRLEHGRKWMLSPHMTTSEIVQTAFMAVLAFEEHETRENFTYCGASIFGPHFDVDDLVVLAKSAGAKGARLLAEMEPKEYPKTDGLKP